MRKATNRTTGGRALNFNRALHSYPKKSYYKPPHKFFLPSSCEIDISGIGRFDQGQQGSCTGNAWANLYDIRQVQSAITSPVRFHPEFWPAARDYIYYQERVTDGDPGSDNGSFLHTGAYVLAMKGTVSEKVYPYGDQALYEQPSAQINLWAYAHRLTHPKPVPLNPAVIMETLLNNDPIVFGMPVYNEFEQLNSSNFTLTMPAWFEQPLGGHANILYGYETVGGKRYYKDLNSWGSQWGSNGTCLIPEDFVLQFFSDLWTAMP